MLRRMRDEGISVRSWRAIAALCSRASMSEIGSVIMALVSLSFPGFPSAADAAYASRSDGRDRLPARLQDAGDVSPESEEPEADAAELEFAVVTARAPADLATVAVTNGELLSAIELREIGSCGHLVLPRRGLRTEGHAERLEECLPLLVGLRAGDERDVHP